MGDLGLGAMEARFADIIWELEPVGSNELVRRAESEFGWKKSTTYTVLKRLRERGLFKRSGDGARFPGGLLLRAQRALCGGDL